MELKHCLPVWEELTFEQQQRLSDTVARRQIPRGTAIHRGSLDCTGLLVVEAGQLRAYILSEEGREITIYRLLEGDVCLFSASFTTFIVGSSCAIFCNDWETLSISPLFFA